MIRDSTCLLLTLSSVEVLASTVSGGPRDVANHIAEYAAAGADRVVVALDRESWPAQCDLVAEARAFLP
ncbi:MAG TPA: hypothetical protein VH912_08910 [Streptosporangiaceae bacterium]